MSLPDHVVSFGTLFLQDCYRNKSWSTPETAAARNLSKHTEQVQGTGCHPNPTLFLSLTTPPNFFHVGALFPAVERSCRKPVTFQLILS